MNLSKIILGVATGALVSTAAMASSLPIGTPGQWRFSFTALDGATVGYDTTGPNIVCADVAACDAAPGATPSANSFGDDTWGVARVNEISVGGTSVFNPGDNGEFATAIFYGLQDQGVSHNTDPLSGSTTVNTFSTGGFIDIYIDTNDDGSLSAVPSERTAQDMFPGFTEGELLLRLAFGVQSNIALAGTTLAGSYSEATVGGGSSAFLDVVGGTAADFFDTDSTFDLGGTPHDFALGTLFLCDPASVGTSCNPTNDPALDLFTVLVEATLVGTVPVPLPGSAVLLVAGITLLGWRKRQQRKVVVA